MKTIKKMICNDASDIILVAACVMGSIFCLIWTITRVWQQSCRNAEDLKQINAILNTWTYKGDWHASKEYNVNDVVTYEGSTYICTARRTAPGTKIHNTDCFALVEMSL